MERQSTSFAGSDEDSSAFLRRCVSLWARAEMRAFISATTLSSSREVCVLSSRLGEAKRAFSSLVTTFATICAHGGGAEHLLGLPLELRLGHAHGEDGGEPRQDVVLLELVVAEPSAGGRSDSTCARSTFISAASKPCWCVPPLGVAMMFTNERVVVS